MRDAIERTATLIAVCTKRDGWDGEPSYNFSPLPYHMYRAAQRDERAAQRE